MSILLGTLVAWGGGTVGPLQTVLLSLPFVVTLGLQTPGWRGRRKNAVGLGTPYVLLPAILLAGALSLSTGRMEVLWLGPIAVAGTRYGRGSWGLWGLALGGTLLAFCSTATPGWLAVRELTVRNDGLLLLQAIQVEGAWQRGLGLAITAFALEGAVLLLGDRRTIRSAGIALLAGWLAGALICHDNWTLFAGSAAILTGLAVSTRHRVGDPSRGLWRLSGVAFALTAALLGAILIAGPLGFRPNWFSSIEIPLLRIAWAWHPGETGSASTMVWQSTPALLAALGLALVAAPWLWHGTRAVPERDTERNLRAAQTIRTVGCLVWCMGSGLGLLDPLLWWSAGSLHAARPEAPARAPRRRTYLTLATRVSMGAWLAAVGCWAVAGLISGPSLLTSTRLLPLDLGPVVGSEANQALLRVLPAGPYCSYIRLRAMAEGREGEDTTDTLDPIWSEAEKAAEDPALAPWAWWSASQTALAADDGDRCILAMQRVVESPEAPPGLLARCADLLRFSQAKEATRTALERSVNGDPFNAKLRSKLASYYDRNDEHEAARRQRAAARVLNPVLPE